MLSIQGYVATGIYECNQGCPCSRSCHNRVAQNPTRCNLQVFKTADRGWGLRTLHDIPAGTFICVYVGCLYSGEEGNKVGRNFGDEYFAELDFIEVVENAKRLDVEGDEDSDEGIGKDESSDKDESFKTKKSSTVSQQRKSKRKRKTKRKVASSQSQAERSKNFVSVRNMIDQEGDTYIMDAMKTGNIGRYMNHSCNPNVFVQNVFVDTHDLRFPWIAFFSSTHVKSGQELCWDYGYEVGSVPDKVIQCNCGSELCRGRLL